jgi:L-seryl-tRNA(Ser) seleniumtransferase
MDGDQTQRLLRKLPGIDRLLEKALGDPALADAPRPVITRAARETIQELRSEILGGSTAIGEQELEQQLVLDRIKKRVDQILAPNLVRTVNATCVVVHTNLGRSLLAEQAMENVTAIAGRYSNLEFDLARGRRGSRYQAIEDILCEISGAEAALVVNNNAGAVFICLETFARGLEVIVSRGELVEIGGSFRIPDVMAKSGGILKEVGTTNRTHPRDYENAISDNTALLLKVHQSNFSIVGFTKAVTLKELAELGRAHDVPVMEDLGSGTFIDFSPYGLAKEPTVQDSVAAGVDVVTFSGDKLLGGPQAGLIVGKKEYIDQIKNNPLNRALRIDKMTLAALESTLQLYRDPEKAVDAIPTLRMLTIAFEEIRQNAEALQARLAGPGTPGMHVEILERSSRTGGGALPLQELPSVCLGVRIAGLTVNHMEQKLRANTPPIIGRIEDDTFIMDLRTIQHDEFPIIESAFNQLLEERR